MPLQDWIKRIINDVFVNYEWDDALPKEEFPAPIIMDVYVDQCATRCAEDMVDKVNVALAADGRGAELTDGEKRLVHFKMLGACKSRCERNAELSMESVALVEELGDANDYSDRSPEDFLENLAADSADLARMDGINMELIPISDDAEEG